MSLAIKSNLFRPSDLRALFQFVCTFTKYSDIAKVTVQDGKPIDSKGEPGFGGLAGALGNGDYTVTIALRKGLTYPRSQRLNHRTPEVTFASWDEEFVVVLAHELRHIDQFVLGAFDCFQEFESEIDAETFAVAVLKAYREMLAIDEAA